MRQHPAFWAASQYIKPNQMTRSAVDGEGQSNKGRKHLPLVEDRWDYFGTCVGGLDLRHRTDRCDNFRDRFSLVARVLNLQPGEGFQAPPAPPAPAPADPEEVEVVHAVEVQAEEVRRGS